MVIEGFYGMSWLGRLFGGICPGAYVAWPRTLTCLVFLVGDPVMPASV